MPVRGPPDDRDPDALRSFGVVNLDKPPGPSAHQVAAWVRDATGQDRVAHGGTLDPKVTGCLPILLGDAARMARVFDDAVKEYVAVLELHGDAPADFEGVVAEFEGEIYQKPPRKSAVKRQLRTRRIHALDVLEREDRRALLRVRCASGTYVRKLCHDIGLALGTGAHMGDLRRTATGTFDDSDLATMHDLVDALAFAEADDDTAPLRETIRPAERALVHLPRVTIAPSAAREVANGASVFGPGVIDASPAEVGDATLELESLVACYTPDGAAVCLGTLVGDPDADSGTVVALERVLV
ncbi:RNA-guided pseudouridylation complex pseudouridine synthase subunit Cbf5 [Haloarcula nitratireducens]|uniref:Probable tRNA pseudouridine synthase B n=1 Tax=Haloarcula nitratireducens TaxID=2487749 RepID=A0AAW4PBK2_9EURY|nr:RNA-guided pseudouridylation complex pseudouridine synthase subunit Cbf5 [Halomicroarcula nitratireducens]MBX0295045.1 RNA-guided pseudouridylation complex pseudouridine synthase subunit Cbf5 [Halomicroarcula nitratireducens]